jgi:hypothetical protein
VVSLLFARSKMDAREPSRPFLAETVAGPALCHMGLFARQVPDAHPSFGPALGALDRPIGCGAARARFQAIKAVRADGRDRVASFRRLKRHARDKRNGIGQFVSGTPAQAAMATLKWAAAISQPHGGAKLRLIMPCRIANRCVKGAKAQPSIVPASKTSSA